MIKYLRLLLRISRSNLIARRYFVVNGFDGALTIVGLLMGFIISAQVEISIVITACLATAIALAVSGISSAYISEAAERQQELKELEQAMVTDLQDSAHGQAARLIPWLVAFVNGLAPLIIALIILTPLFLTHWNPELISYPLQSAILTGGAVIFLLGVFLGKISGTVWLWSGFRALLVALLTCILIYLIQG